VLTAAAVRRFGHLADHRSIVKKGGGSSVVDPLTLLLPEQTDKIRYLDTGCCGHRCGKALEKRVYPLGIETELHLEVKDDLLPENNGKFCLKRS